MDIEQIVRQNYNSLVDPFCIPVVVEFIAANPTTCERGADFCKKITKVAAHIYRQNPAILNTQLPRLHDYCHEGIVLGLTGSAAAHIYGYAGDFARHRYGKVHNPKWAHEALKDYQAATSLSSDEPLFAAAQHNHQARIHRRLFSLNDRSEHLYEAYRRDTSAADHAQTARPSFARACLYAAARDAGTLFVLTNDPAWSVRQGECTERARLTG